MNLSELISNSVAVYNGIVTHYPQYDTDYPYYVEGIVSKFVGCYATNNSTIAFVYNGQLYATPYRSDAIDALRNLYYQERSFCVPFSNGDYPKADEKRWVELREAARKFCDEHC